MNKFYLCFFILISALTHAQNFELSEQNSFAGVFYGDCAIADFNNDGKDDFLYSGATTGYDTGNTSMYINSADGLYLLDAGFSNIEYSSIATGDLSGNGYIDFIITGTKNELDGTNEPIFEIYYNNGDLTFTKNIFSGIPNVTFGSLKIADFNNDGIQDILVNGLNGNSYISKIYFQDEEGNFTDSQIPLMGTYFSDTAVFDANDDGYPDILITGFNTNYVPDTKLYINQQDGTFTEEQSGLDSVYFSSISVKDINNDGIPDLLLSGMNAEYIPILKTYTNNGLGQFTVENTFTGTYGGSSSFVDYDNDGLLDLFSMGSNEDNQNTVLFYTNNGDGTFTVDLDSASNITGLNMGSAIWFDYDNDTDKDLFTMGFSGTEGASNLYKNLHFTPEEPCNQNPGPNAGDTGCVTFDYNGQQVTYTTVRTAEGNIWIQQNLGSISTSTDENAFGDLFQWGRWDDGHQLRNSEVTTTVASPNNPLAFVEADPTFYLSDPEWWDGGQSTDTWNAKNTQNVTETNGCDPCKALGQNWRLPTQEEWQSLIDAENITNIATAFESNLKLAVAGARSTSGIYNAGVRGYYWSSTMSDSNSSFAKYLYYSNAIVNPNAGGFREQGSSIRCLKMLIEDYCAVSVDFEVEPITSVSFATISNTSSAVINQTPAYEDFTTISTDVEKGQTYNLAVKGNTAGEFEHDIRVFFDWNQDKVFDMDTEYYTVSLLPSTGTDDVVASIDIVIPINAALGETRMRIIKDMWNVYEEGEFDACLNAYYGQVEDYSLIITESATAIESVIVTTQGNMPAQITTNNGTLQLNATILPASIEQNTTWSVNSGTSFASVSETGLVTAMATGNIIVRATSTFDNTKFGEITIAISNQGNVEFPFPYCNIDIEDSDPYYIEPITFFSFSNISNTSSAAIGGTPVLENFTSTIGNVTLGETYPLVVKGNTNGNFETNIIRIYFDWNQNGIFEANEGYAVGTIYGSNGTDEVSVTANITIPLTALIGNTRMRIVKDYEENNTDACNDIYFGQAEDYTLNIQENLAIGDFSKNTIKIYPNPTNDFVNIQSETALKNIEVYNTLGQLVVSQSDSKVNLSNFASGIYLLQIHLENGNVFTQKIIKK